MSKGKVCNVNVLVGNPKWTHLFEFVAGAKDSCSALTLGDSKAGTNYIVTEQDGGSKCTPLPLFDLVPFYASTGKFIMKF